MLSSLMTKAIPLTDSTFWPTTMLSTEAKKPWFIFVYAPYCPHCRGMYDAWDELEAYFKESGEVGIGEVDGTVEKQLMADLKVRGYPTLLFFDNDGPVYLHQGNRDAESLIKIAKGEMRRVVRDENYTDLIPK